MQNAKKRQASGYVSIWFPAGRDLGLELILASIADQPHIYVLI